MISLSTEKSKIGNGLTLFEDWTGIKDKSGKKGLIFFEGWESKTIIVLKGHA